MAFSQEISRADAARHLCAFDLVDPEGSATVDSVVRNGKCFALDFQTGRMVYVIEPIGSTVWITAAAGRTQSATRRALSHIEAQAQAMGARLVKFQTVRAGLARLAHRAGYTRHGFVFSKAIA